MANRKHEKQPGKAVGRRRPRKMTPALGSLLILSFAFVVYEVVEAKKQSREIGGTKTNSSNVAPAATEKAVPARTDAASPAVAPANPNTSATTKNDGKKKTNVVLITVDALRADSLGCYGSTKVKTPNLDALAAKGLRVANHVTPVPISWPSIATIMTGLWPARHMVRDNGPYYLDANLPTLAETFAQYGYNTAAFVSSFFLDSRYGAGQGFEVYDQKFTKTLAFPTLAAGLPQRTAMETRLTAVQWLNRRAETGENRPFFLWVHFVDPMPPYTPPDPFSEIYQDNPYAGEVANVDQEIGFLVGALRQQGVFDSTVIAVVGTHGEGLMDHKEENHGTMLYESTIAVPMIWHHAALFKPAVLSDRVGCTLDITATLEQLLHVGSGRRIDGRNVLTDTDYDRLIYLETLAPKLRYGWAPITGLRGRGAKFVDAPMPEFYDLEADRSESANLWGADSQSDETIRNHFGQMQNSLGESTLRNPFDDGLGVETMAQLTARGVYPRPLPSKSSEPFDAKKGLATLDQIDIVHLLASRGRYIDASTESDRLIQMAPYSGLGWDFRASVTLKHGNIGGALISSLNAVKLQPRERHWARLARILAEKGDAESLALVVDQMQKIDPLDGEILLARAESLIRQKKFAEAIPLAEEAARIDPYRVAAAAHTTMGDAYAGLKDETKAREQYDLSLTIDSGNTEALEGLAGIEQRAGNGDAQIKLLERLCQTLPGKVAYFNELAQSNIQLGRSEEAIAASRRYAEAFPKEAMAWGNLGNVYVETGNYDKAIESFDKSLQLQPEYIYALYNKANALQRLGDIEGAIAQYSKVVANRPKHDQALVRLLKLLVSVDRVDEALKVVEKAAKLRAVKWDELANTEELDSLLGNSEFQRIREQDTRKQETPENE